MSIVVGEHPIWMTTILVAGSTAHLVVPSKDGALAAPHLEFAAGRADAAPAQTYPLALVSGEWMVTLTEAQVAALSGVHFARVTDGGRTIAAGYVQYNPGWDGDSSRVVTSSRIIYGGGTGGASTWAGITDKPTEFPPTDHSHDDRYYTEAEVDQLISGVSGGGSLAQIGTLTLPSSPVAGQNVTVLADSTTILPEGVTWDSGGEPTVTDRLLISLVWSGTDWVGTYGPSIPAYVAPLIEVTPTGPTWTDDATNGGGTWTTPTEAGVVYSPASGTAQPDETVTVTATADTGYTLVGTTSWQHAFPPAPIPEDTADPTPGTLTDSAHTSSGFTLTVTGASDAGSGLHAQPYRFSTDNGTTWTAWQASASYAATGLAADTIYTCLHEVRDRAGNTAQGESITATTSGATVLASDDFNRTNGALGTSSGGQVWSTAVTPAFTVVDNSRAGSTAAASRAVIDVGQADHKVFATYVAANAYAAAVILRSDAAGTDYFRVIATSTETRIDHVIGNTTVQTRDTWAAAGLAPGERLSAQAVATEAGLEFTVWRGGTIVRTYTETDPAYILDGTHAGIWGGVGVRLDDFEVTTP